MSGGTTVVVTGQYFPTAPGLKCRFGPGTAAVPATVVNDTSLSCVAPAHAPAVVVLSLEWYSPVFRASSSALFEYVLVPRVVAVSPSSGSANGGTFVVVSGVAFSSAERSLACAFDGIVVPASLLPGARRPDRVQQRHRLERRDHV